jgi:hypothetical protein
MDALVPDADMDVLLYPAGLGGGSNALLLFLTFRNEPHVLIKNNEFQAKYI